MIETLEVNIMAKDGQPPGYKNDSAASSDPALASEEDAAVLGETFSQALAVNRCDLIGNDSQARVQARVASQLYHD